MSEFVFKSLREDIDLYPGTRGTEGLPTYVLHDKWRNKFVNIGWLEFEILKRWYLKDPVQIANAVNHETTLYAEPDDIGELTNFLSQEELLEENLDTKSLMDKGRKYKEALAKSKIKLNPMAYLMFRIPFLKPDKFLESTMWMIRPFMTRTAFVINLILLTLSVLLVLQQWHPFMDYVSRALSLEGAAYVFFALAVSKTVHEFGHAYTCKRFGLKVSTMGFMWMIMFPFLYTDTTESWKLESRKKRIAIGAAGVLAEMQLAIIATLLWTILPDGALRYACFYLATAAWVATLLINLSPFLRWDGYWVLSDLVGIQNLRERSNSATSWWFGRIVMGFNDPCPITLPARQVKFSIVFAILSWFYRIGIFLGIGLLIFERLPKILGIYALIMMLSAMVFKPIFSAVWGWGKRYKEMNWNRYSISSFVVIGLVLLVIFLPWKSSIVIPGVIAPKLHNEVFPGVEGRVLSIPPQGHYLNKGETLFEMDNRDLEHDLLEQKTSIDYYSTALQRIGSDTLLENRSMDRERLRMASSEYIRVARTAQRLSAKAPYDGQVVWVNKMAAKGNYISQNEAILTFIDPRSNELFAYIGEYDLQRLNRNGRARFYPEHPFYEPINAEIVAVDTANASVLDYEILSSTTGGPITATSNSTTGKLEPSEPIYLVRMKISPEERSDYPTIIRGRVLLEGERKSYASHFFDSLIGTIIRESGF